MGKSYFFVGIGGSGMLPLAEIVARAGHRVAGSDRSLDQGRMAAKFDRLRSLGIELFAQDGSGITSADQIVVASTAIEASVPDIARADALGCVRMHRAELLAELFNAAPLSIAVGGTSGKSTVTGMIAWIMTALGRDPTVMNGAVMKNFASGARVGSGDVFVSEVDESDGSIALYRPGIAVVNNIALDHKPMDELRALFRDFVGAAGQAVVNADNEDSAALPGTRFGFAADADVRAVDMVERRDGCDFTVHAGGESAPVSLAVPGRHNVANALAAIAATRAAGLALPDIASALGDYAGIARRLDIVGSTNGITVIDDFGHNPDKVAATLTTLHAFPGRLLILFQPHGYGPLKVMGRALAESFAAHLGAQDRLFVCDPVYFGGTTDRSIGSDALVGWIGAGAEHVATRDDCAARIVALARPGDRIVVMGARDDTLPLFARGMLDAIAAAEHAA